METSEEMTAASRSDRRNVNVPTGFIRQTIEFQRIGRLSRVDTLSSMYAAPHGLRELQVLDAILTERFYVLPNEEWTSAVGERAARIMAGGPIAPPPVPDA